VLDVFPAQNRDANQIYTEMLENQKIAELKNQGYNFVVVDWKNSRIDIRFNALYVVKLIEKLKCMMDDKDNHQFVIIGESMGGIVARYALTYMETDFYQNHITLPFFTDIADLNNTPYLATHYEELLNVPWCKEKRKHNTRLFFFVC